MKKYLVAPLFLLAFSLANAEGAGARLVKPEGTAKDLSLADLKKTDGLSATFDGQTWVSGTFVARWPAGASAMAYTTPDYKLVPDRASMSRLPHFVINDPPHNNSYKVSGIDIQNGEEALRRVFPPGAVKRILGRKTDSIRTTGRFLIERYVVGVECDASWSSARLVKADLPDQLAVVHQKVPVGC